MRRTAIEAEVLLSEARARVERTLHDSRNEERQAVERMREESKLLWRTEALLMVRQQGSIVISLKASAKPMPGMHGLSRSCRSMLTTWP